MQAVCEAARNIAASGARPLAITNNLNFGNPEKINVMGEIVGSIKGISQAALTLNTPIVSGNVSLYNETNGQGILPTPVIGMVGIIDEVENSLGISAENNNTLIILGQQEDFIEGWLGCSLYQEIVTDDFDGAPPPINLNAEKKIIDMMLTLNDDNLLTGAHDISDGGLLTAICEMLFENNLGLNVNLPKALLSSKTKDHLIHSWCFGENQGRIIISTNKTDKVVSLLKKHLIDYFILGSTNTTSNLNLSKVDTISISELNSINEATIPSIMD
jgi:phosphoribosylformylglycinamidine synthase